MGTGRYTPRTNRISAVSAKRRRSTHPVEHFVICACKGQEPWLSVIKSERCAREGNCGERNFTAAAAHHLSQFCTQICSHSNAVSGIAQCIINPIRLPSMRHGVKAKVQRSAPGVFDAEIAQLRIDLDHIASQNFCAALDCVAGLWKECGPASEQHAIIWR